jgi:hypothetical protein
MCRNNYVGCRYPLAPPLRNTAGRRIGSTRLRRSTDYKIFKVVILLTTNSGIWCVMGDPRFRPDGRRREMRLLQHVVGEI